MIISVWSPVKRSGKTLFLYSLVNAIYELANSEISVLSICLNSGGFGKLLSMFGVTSMQNNASEYISSLVEAKAKINLKDILPHVGGMYFSGTQNRSLTDKSYGDFIRVAGEEFDLVFIDTISGKRSGVVGEALAASDGVINIVEQDYDILNDFIIGKEIIYVINRYKGDVFPNKEDFEYIFKIKNIHALPECKMLLNMKNKGELDKYPWEDTEYNRTVNKIAGEILNSIGRHAAIKNMGKAKFNLNKLFGWRKICGTT